MAQGKSKLLAISTALFVVLTIIFFTLSITTIGGFTAQKKRVHHLEQKMLAGKAEILKVPEMIGKLRVADKTNNELEGQVAELTEENEELGSELAETQKELTITTIAKAVLEMDKSGYTKNLIEARQAVEELREQLSTGDGGTNIDYIEETLLEATPYESTEETSATPLSVLQDTLGLIEKKLKSSHFMFLSPVERFEKLNDLITKAKKQSKVIPELNQLIEEFTEKLSSAESSLSEIFASLEEVQANL